MYNIDALKVNLKNRLDKEQYLIATTRTEETGYRRVRGPAGSGKSLTLAARAAVLASEGKEVLVCTYNITLHNYLRDLIEQLMSQQIPPHITFTNFHAWCKYVCEVTGHMSDYRQLWNYSDEERLVHRTAELVSKIYGKLSNTSILPIYDAILVDEGQDYQIHWWQALRKAHVQGGEMLLVTDKTQNVYGTAQAWTDEAMIGCGFRGAWNNLTSSYRLPDSMIPILEDFAEQYLIPHGGEVNIPPRRQFAQADLFNKFRWVQGPLGKSVVDICIEEVERLYSDPAIPTVHFLSEEKIGTSVVREFRRRGANIFDTHSGNWKEKRNNKVNFHPRCADILATTLHSFKGWETSHLVVHVERIENSKDRAAFYTALSRLNNHPNGAVLTVVSSCPKLQEFGRKHFPDPTSLNLDSFNLDIAVDAIPF